MIYHIFLLIGILLSVTGQLLLKKGMNRYKKFRINDFPKLIKNQTVMMGIIAYGASVPLWLLVLKQLDLSYAFPMVSLNYFFIALFSKWIFKEHISKKRWLSIATIVFGVILVSLS